LSDPQILLCGPALDAVESAYSLEMMQSVTLPNVTKYVVVAGKFNVDKSVKAFNVETGYPAEPAHLQTLAARAEVPHRDDPRFRDGYDLFCLRGILAKRGPPDIAVLLRDSLGFDKLWPDLLANAQNKMFLTFSGSKPSAAVDAARQNILFNLQDENTHNLLDLGWDLYATGAAYGISPYSLDAVFMTAANAQRFERELDPLPKI
jgi:hypothetical protein